MANAGVKVKGLTMQLALLCEACGWSKDVAAHVSLAPDPTHSPFGAPGAIVHECAAGGRLSVATRASDLVPRDAYIESLEWYEV